MSDYVSTRWYRAPECLFGLTDYDEKVDIFALGCIMAEMFRMKPLFTGKNTSDQLKRIHMILGTPLFEGRYKKFKDLAIF